METLPYEIIHYIFSFCPEYKPLGCRISQHLRSALGSHPLTYAHSTADVTLLKYSISCGANLRKIIKNITSRNGQASDQCVRYFIKSWDPDIFKLLCWYSVKYGNYILYSRICEKGPIGIDNPIHAIIKYNRVGFLDWFITYYPWRRYQVISSDATWRAAKVGNFEITSWMIANGSKFADVSKYAAKFGRVDILRHSYICNKHTVVRVGIKYGHISVLKHMLIGGFSYTSRIYKYAVVYNKLVVLKWLYENNYKMNLRKIADYASGCGFEEISNWALNILMLQYID